jgi:UDP-N-acetylmuramyl tripeptide synthase
LVLIAGKGHETTQQIGAARLPFSDPAAVQQAFRYLAEVRA